MSRDRETPTQVSGTAGHIDDERALELHKQGMRDPELAKTFGVSKSTVVKWRQKHGLTANRVAVWNTDKAQEMYNNGASDAEIAAALSEAGCSITAAAVSTWRRQQGLGANRRVAGKTASLRSEPAKDPTETSPTPGRQPIEPGPFAKTTDLPQSTEDIGEAEQQRETRRERLKKTHLVAVPPSEGSRSAREETEPGRRRKRYKARPLSALPMASPYKSRMGDDSDMIPTGFLEESADPEQDTLYLFASLLHVCRMQFDWTDEDIKEYLDAVMFTEGVIADVEVATIDFLEAEVGHMMPGADEDEPDDDPPPFPNRGAKKGSGKKRRS